MRNLLTLLLVWLLATLCSAQDATSKTRADGVGGGELRHLLYVAVPGIRDYSQYGGHGILVFDIDHGHQFVRRIKVPAMGTDTHSQAAKGICASSATGRLYVSNTRSLTCIDLATDSILWEKTYESGCDRMSISPDGSTIYEPTLEGKFWHVISGKDGTEIAQIPTGAGAHNTIFSLDGKHVYLAALHSPVLTIADARTRTAEGTAGPFAAPIRPFTVNGAGTLCFVNINELLGFEVGDMVSGKKLYRVEIQGFAMGETKRHGCPSHGIGLTPDEKELWVTDAHNSRLHIFDNTVMPPRQMQSIELHDQPGWITFSIDGRYAYPSSGEVIDVASRKIVTTLKDERGQDVQSEKLMEIDFFGGKPVHAGDQFGVGRVMSAQTVSGTKTEK
jgi:hypothetical protein